MVLQDDHSTNIIMVKDSSTTTNILDRAAHRPSGGYGCPMAGQVTGMDLSSTVCPSCQQSANGRMGTEMAVLRPTVMNRYINILQ